MSSNQDDFAATENKLAIVIPAFTLEQAVKLITLGIGEALITMQLSTSDVVD